MARQPEQNTDRYYDVFPTTLRGLLEKHPKDGHTTTYKALGEAVGVRQQTISQYACGQTQPTADVVLRIAQFFGVSVDYLLTGVSSFNKDYCEELGLSEASIEFLKRARQMYPQADPDRARTIPFLDEILSDKDFYEFLDDLYDQVERLRGVHGMTDKMKAQYKGLDVEGYYIWSLQTFVREFIRNELVKFGMKIELM